METPYRAAGDVFVIPSSETAPGCGVLPVNAYLIRDRRPVLVDTGLALERDDFLDTLWSLVDPDDLAWIFLTHDDRDHAGNLLQVIEAAPRAGLVMNYMALSKLNEGVSGLPIDRVRVVNPGQVFDTGARELSVLQPPVYDSPGTVGLYDPDADLALTVDAFGSYLPELVRNLSEVSESDLRSGLADFNRANHPWINLLDRSRLEQELAELVHVNPRVLLSSHGVLAEGRTEHLVDALVETCEMEPFVTPDQAEFEELKEEMG
jgi:flavorubredoxin